MSEWHLIHRSRPASRTSAPRHARAVCDRQCSAFLTAAGADHTPSLFGAGASVADEEFFDMLVLIQSSRLDDQRSPGTRGLHMAFVGLHSSHSADQGAKLNVKAPELTDDMSFFDMLSAAKADSSS